MKRWLQLACYPTMTGGHNWLSDVAGVEESAPEWNLLALENDQMKLTWSLYKCRLEKTTMYNPVYGMLSDCRENTRHTA